MNKSSLFSPVKLGHNQLTHRVVLAPLTRFRATLSGEPTDSVVKYYSQRASPGGLMITEATFINPLSGGFPHAPGIYTQTQLQQWKKVASAVHKKGAIIFLQVWHVGRAGTKYLNPNQEEVISASSIAIGGNSVLTGQPFEVPRAMDIKDIKEVIADHRQAALNAIEAGFDGIEILSATGYLLDQFINSNSNKRTDQYGGNKENRCRLVLEVIGAVVDAVGQERTSIRLSPGGNFQDMKDDTPIETYSYLVSQLQERFPRLAYIHLIEARSNFFTDEVNTVDTLAPYRKIWKGPIITASGFSTATQHAIDFSERTGSLVAFGRAFVANPDLPHRLCHNLPLNKYDRSTFYTNDDVGYTDYPFTELTQK
ncbi:hypothetical protein HPULCUR_010423 [Helicostylum pulchrum]|uniref:NADH:flavin oxidoreductase/NADH oxidase N-terminal domain-containing protein n=1 Tax=Helicostylum pulchrum TaxID=562976 RepID=A0ABP9YD76_9FUNG